MITKVSDRQKMSDHQQMAESLEDENVAEVKTELKAEPLDDEPVGDGETVAVDVSGGHVVGALGRGNEASVAVVVLVLGQRQAVDPEVPDVGRSGRLKWRGWVVRDVVDVVVVVVRPGNSPYTQGS